MTLFFSLFCLFLFLYFLFLFFPDKLSKHSCENAAHHFGTLIPSQFEAILFSFLGPSSILRCAGESKENKYLKD